MRRFSSVWKKLTIAFSRLHATLHNNTEIIVAVFTVVLAFIAYLQWDALDRTDHNIAKQDETARLRDRAFLYFSNIDPIPYPPNNPVVWGGSIGISNTGNVPATQVKTKFACPISEKPNDDPFAITSEWINLDVPNVIGPKQFIGPIWLAGCDIPIATINEARQSKKHIYFAVEVRYLDGFDKKKIRITRTGRIYRFDAHNGVGMGFAGAHNCSDDDCPTKATERAR